MVLGKWFRKRVVEPLSRDVIPDAAHAAEKRIRQTAETLEEFARKTMPEQDLQGRRQIEQSSLGGPPAGGHEPVDPSPRSSAVFSPGMSAQQVHETVAGLLSDRAAVGVAALPVNYGLKASGKDGVRLDLTTQRSAAGSVVSGSVESLRIPRGGKEYCPRPGGGEKFGEFEWRDPGNGTDPSWSMRLLGDRKRLGEVADSLPEQLAALTPGFDADRVRSVVADAVQVASQHKDLKKWGGSLAAEATGEQLRVRVSKGAIPADMMSADWVLFDRTVTRD
ncbi:hypothetical protein ABZW96_33190 [Nocardia sp. NPDC004168]|uniref:hypothetical protein n=1 Tax=Nocardia sp. NPDC004168 TaxID=3154452 RepID=UPI0033ABB99D